MCRIFPPRCYSQGDVRSQTADPDREHMHPVSSLVSLFLLATFGLSTATHSTAQAQTGAVTNYTGFLATGLRIDPVGEAIDLGSMPLAMALAPGGEKVAVVLSDGPCAWRRESRRGPQRLARAGIADRRPEVAPCLADLAAGSRVFWDRLFQKRKGDLRSRRQRRRCLLLLMERRRRDNRSQDRPGRTQSRSAWLAVSGRACCFTTWRLPVCCGKPKRHLGNRRSGHLTSGWKISHRSLSVCCRSRLERQSLCSRLGSRQDLNISNGSRWDV